MFTRRFRGIVDGVRQFYPIAAKARRPLGDAALVAISQLEVAGCQTGVLGDSGKNARAELLVVMKGEDKVRSFRTRERSV